MIYVCIYIYILYCVSTIYIYDSRNNINIVCGLVVANLLLVNYNNPILMVLIGEIT